MPLLVLIRHGQSAWNLENRSTGWWDVDVTELGAAETKAAGALMAARGLDFDRCSTTYQTPATKTLHLAMEAMDWLSLPVAKTVRLNERHCSRRTVLNQGARNANAGGRQVTIRTAN